MKRISSIQALYALSTTLEHKFDEMSNSLLLRTTDVRGGSDTVRIFRSNVLAKAKTCKFKWQCRLNIGMDAAGLNRSDVSASTETRRQKRTRWE